MKSHTYMHDWFSSDNIKMKKFSMFKSLLWLAYFVVMNACCTINPQVRTVVYEHLQQQVLV